MQALVRHKTLILFNLALVVAFLVAQTSYVQGIDNASISSAAYAWVGLIVILEIIVLPIRALAKHAMHQQDQQASPQQKRLTISNSASILIGAALGFAVTYAMLYNAGADSGLLFIPIAAVLVPLGAFVLYTFSRITFGSPIEKRHALYWFLVAALLIGAIIVYSNHQSGQKYCDGVPVERYQGELPAYCTQ